MTADTPKGDVPEPVRAEWRETAIELDRLIEAMLTDHDQREPLKAFMLDNAVVLLRAIEAASATPSAAPKGDATPGPWRTDVLEINGEIVLQAGDGPDFLAMFFGPNKKANAALCAELRNNAMAPKGDVRGALLDALIALRDAVKTNPTMQSREYVQLGIQVNDAITKAERATPSQDEGEALRSALFLANRDKESILRRLDTDIAGAEARPKSGEINETLRDGALGALRAFRAAIVEYEWTAPREYLTSTQKLENIENAIVDSILAEPAGTEGEPLHRANQSQEDWARELHSYLVLRQALEYVCASADAIDRAREALSRSPKPMSDKHAATYHGDTDGDGSLA